MNNLFSFKSIGTSKYLAMLTHFLQPGDNSVSIKRLESLFSEEGQLSIAVAYFSSMKFANLILKRASDNLPTFLLVNTSDILRPQEVGDTEIAISVALMEIIRAANKNNNIQVRSLGLRDKGKYQNMHHKFYLSEKTLIFGSVNLTDAALYRNYESFIETTDFLVRQKFTIEFDKLWSKASEIHSGYDGKIRSLMCPVCEVNNGVDFESYGPMCTFCGYKFKLK